MKKILGILIVVLLGLSTPALAQGKVEKAENGVKKGANKTWSATKKGAKKVGHKTAEVTNKGVARIKDKKSEQWMGPEGQTIFVDDQGKYYWINGSGKKIYVSESALRARNKQ